MLSVPPLSDRARALSRKADSLISELHAAIRCQCCPDGLFTRHLGAEPATPRAPLSRADFLGLLAPEDIDTAPGQQAV
jgi:hypothetical protein